MTVETSIIRYIHSFFFAGDGQHKSDENKSLKKKQLQQT